MHDRSAGPAGMVHRPTRWAGVEPGWLLAAVLGVALVVRLATVHFGLPGLDDPDELIFEMGALRMLRGPTLDPGWFGHPATTTMYLLALIDAGVFGVARLTGRVASPGQFADLVYGDPTWLILPGRIAMVLFGVATVWLTWRLTDRLLGRPAGFAAALLLALCPVHVRWSQIIRSDVMACVFMLLCLLAAVDVARAGQWRDYRRAALWLGLAVATKWPFALTGLAIGGATVAAVRAGHIDAPTALRRLGAALAAAAGFLVLASPFLVIDFPTVVSNLHGEGQPHHLGSNGGDVAYNFRWYLDGAFSAGFGVVGLALIVVGGVRLVRRREALVILAPVAGAFLLLLCTQHLVWERWALPLMPLGAIFAAAGLLLLADLVRGRARLLRLLPAAVLVAALVPLGARTLGDSRARMNDTRQRAAAWALGHVPPGSTVLVEHLASDMTGEPWRLLYPIGDAGCVEIAALLHGHASYATVDRDRGGRSSVDYGTVAPDKRAGCRSDFAVLTQFDRYRRERTLYPDEYAAYLALIATGRVVATIAPQPGRSSGPVVTIVDLRPRAIALGGTRDGA